MTMLLAPTGPVRGISRRRATLNLAALLCGTVGLDGCATLRRPVDESRLSGDTVALLGEVHDNAEQHGLRHAMLQRALAAGWRPALAMEQFDREHQADIDEARRERPGDVQHLIARAAPVGSDAARGWHWDFYRPYVALALQYELPLLAANLSNADTTRIVRGGDAAVLDATAIARLGLGRTIDAQWQAAQEHEIDMGHCHALPRSLWPRMARAQFARDAVMADVLRGHAGRGAVLLAGNGHARRDLGVPRWLDDTLRARVYAVGFLERGGEPWPAHAFDAMVLTAPAKRDDPCAAFDKRKPAMPGATS